MIWRAAYHEKKSNHRTENNQNLVRNAETS